MRGDFVPKFIKAVAHTGKELHNIWNWQPISYKGVRVVGYRRQRVSAGFKNLATRGIIKSVSKDYFKFTQKGKKWFRGSLVKYYRDLDIPWDGKWRVVMFDIPQELNRERDRFRSRLKVLGFQMIQKSVFVLPYPCQEELGGYCEKLKIGSYVNVIIAESLGYVENEIKKFYGL